MIASEYLKDPQHKLCATYNIKGEGGHRISVNHDILLKNTKNCWTHYVLMGHQTHATKSFMMKCGKSIKKGLESNNPYNNEYVVLESTLEQTPESSKIRISSKQ
jgi:hypothetical protein